MKNLILFVLLIFIASCQELENENSKIGTSTPTNPACNLENSIANIPIFNLMAGTYNSDILLDISSKYVDDTIYYTLDGSDPTTDSPIYINPIAIKNNGTRVYVKAMVKTKDSQISEIHTSYYYINYSYDSKSYKSHIQIDKYKCYMTGKWIGHRICPWTSPINVSVEFLSDGTYTSKSLTPKQIAFYYGEDNEINTYYVYDINSDESATATFGRFNDFNIDQLRFIRFSKDLKVLSFEYWHHNIYGPLKYVLTKVE